MSRRKSSSAAGEGAEQLSLPSPTRPARATPVEIARKAVARRTKPSAVPGHVTLTLTLDLPRTLAERLSERAIREERRLEAVVIEALKAAAKAK